MGALQLTSQHATPDDRCPEVEAPRRFRDFHLRTKSPTDGDNLGAALSPREREITALAADGRQNKEIARSLEISERTVKLHISRALAKSGTRSRVELARWFADTAGAAGNDLGAFLQFCLGRIEHDLERARAAVRESTDRRQRELDRRQHELEEASMEIERLAQMERAFGTLKSLIGNATVDSTKTSTKSVRQQVRR